MLLVKGSSLCVVLRWDPELLVCLTILPNFTISPQLEIRGHVDIIKYSENNSIFVYLAEKGGNFANFKNLIFLQSPELCTSQRKKMHDKNTKIFWHTCEEDR